MLWVRITAKAWHGINEQDTLKSTARGSQNKQNCLRHVPLTSVKKKRRTAVQNIFFDCFVWKISKIATPRKKVLSPAGTFFLCIVLVTHNIYKKNSLITSWCEYSYEFSTNNCISVIPLAEKYPRQCSCRLESWCDCIALGSEQSIFVLKPVGERLLFDWT
jgi:hypothetical protein